MLGMLIFSLLIWKILIVGPVLGAKKKNRVRVGINRNKKEYANCGL